MATTSFDGHKNFAQTLVAVAPSPATSGNSLTVSTGTGSLLPATPFNATVQPVGVLPTSTNAEIVRVTNITGDVLTITRGQEGTTPLAIEAAYQIGATVTAKTLTDIESAVNQASAGTTFNVLDHGVVGDGSTDNTAALNTLLTTVGSGGGGIVFFPPGYYVVSTGTLNVPIGVIIRGSGAQATYLEMLSASYSLLSSNNSELMGIEDITLYGPGSGTSAAVNWVSSTNISNCYIKNVAVENFTGGSGFYVQNPECFVLDNVGVYNGAIGFYFTGGAGVTFNGALASGCTTGFEISGVNSVSMVGSVASAGTTGYLINGATSGNLDGCIANAQTSGTGFELSGASGVSLNGCISYSNPGKAFWVTGSSKNVSLISCTELSPVGGATASIQVDSGSTALVVYPTTVTATSYASGTTGLLTSTGFTAAAGTFTGAVSAGSIAASSSSTTGAIETVTNTHSTPSAPNVKNISNAAGDPAYGFYMSTDTVPRLAISSNGLLQWGAGGSSAADTTVGRLASGVVYSPGTVLVGASAALGDNGVGEIQLANAGTPPTTATTAGASIFAKSGHLKYMGTDGLTYQAGAYVGYLTTNQAATSAAVTIAGLSAALGVGTYAVEVNIAATNAAAQTATFSFTMGSGAATLLGFALATPYTSGTAQAAVFSSLTATTSTIAPVLTSTQTGLVVTMTFILTVSTAGTFAIQEKSSVSTSDYTVLAGSTMVITPYVA